MPEVLGLPIAGLTAPTLLLVGVWLIMTGRLVPRRTHDDMKADRDYWRTAHGISEQARIEQARQSSAMLEVGHTVETVMHALANPASKPGTDGRE